MPSSSCPPVSCEYLTIQASLPFAQVTDRLLSGAFIVDPLNHYLGRRGELFLTAICLTATPIGSAFARTWQELFAARLIMGIGIGAKNATVPIYSAEMAPARVRGALVMFWQLWVVAGKLLFNRSQGTFADHHREGIFLGLCANVIVKDVGKIAWRLQFGSAFIPSFILLLGIWFCPESPRWLMKHGKLDKGFQSMRALRAHPIIAARDYYYSYVIYQQELKETKGSGYFSRMWDCFAVPRIRRANYGASTVMIAQQMCGINSKSPHTSYKSSVLIRCSHFFLQLQYFRKCRLHTCSSLVRVPRIWCHPARSYDPYSVPDRY
jgi:MFS family permease